MEWERPAVMLAVGMTDDGGIAGEGFGGQPFLNATTPERRGSRAEPPIFIDDIVDWEPELAASSEDGSDYSASEDRESQDDGESLKSLDNEEESGDTEDEVQLRRSSRRNKRKAEVCCSEQFCEVFFFLFLKELKHFYERLRFAGLNQ